jgi:Tfp pilus assembly protein PilF
MVRFLAFLVFFLVAGCAHTPGQEMAISAEEAESRLMLAENYLVEAEPRMALEQLRIIESQTQQCRRLHFLFGVSYKLLDDLEMSSRAYERAVEIDPYFGEAWNNLGQVKQALGEYEASRRAYEHALTLDGYMTPEFAAYNMASLFAEQGKLEQALTYSRMGIDKNRRYIPLYRQSADLLRQAGRLGEAVDTLHMGVSARPDCMSLRILLAEELIRMGREREAKKWFARIIEQEPESDEAETAAHYLEVFR